MTLAIGATLLLSFTFVTLSVTSVPLWQSEITLSDLNEIGNSVREDAFNAWTIYFNKDYISKSDDGDEKAHRYMVWLENWHSIASHNSDPDSTFKMGMNLFGDLTPDEFVAYVHGPGPHGSCTNPKKADADYYDKDVLASLAASAPDAVDWTTKGVVTPVKNQGNCGSCWTFSATGEIECRYAIKTGTLQSLSEQELVDCARGREYDNSDGCNGGEENAGMQYAADNHGLCSEAEYPYTAKNGQCRAQSCATRYDANTGVRYTTKYNSTALQTQVVDGCVSVAIDASSALQHYSSGVFDGDCGTRIDHAVLVVGYGTGDGNAQYWKVKNSWGMSWGEQGYVRMCRNCNKNGKNGECGILMWPSIALF